MAETSTEELSEYVIIADNFVGVFAPIVTDAFAGVMLSEFGTAGETASGAEFVIDPEPAEIVTDPCFNVVASPVELIVATVVSELDHASPVSALDVPSE